MGGRRNGESGEVSVGEESLGVGGSGSEVRSSVPLVTVASERVAILADHTTAPTPYSNPHGDALDHREGRGGPSREEQLTCKVPIGEGSVDGVLEGVREVQEEGCFLNEGFPMGGGEGRAEIE